MWRLAAVVLGGALVLSVNTMHVPRTLACSAGPDWDPVAEADVIVEGRVLGYEALAVEPAQTGFVPVRVDMDITRVFKGDLAPGPLAIVDTTSLMPIPEESWHGSSGACGAFDEDPTGKYAMFGLHLQDDGTLRPNRLLIFFYGTGPEDERYAQSLERMRAFPAAATLPALGSQSSVASFEWLAPTLAAVGLAVFGIGLLGVATLLDRPRRAS